MKKFKLVNGEEAECTQSASQFQWDLCIFCQAATSEVLQCPLDSKRTDLGAGYKSVAVSLYEFREIDALPLSLRFSDLDDGRGIEATLTSHKAKWHKSCHNLYNKTKLDRLRKRKLDISVNVSDACMDSDLPQWSTSAINIWWCSFHKSFQCKK